MRLLLVRHASTWMNEEGRFQGASDPPLSAVGRSEARRLARSLAGEPWVRAANPVWTSDLGRAVQTAALLFPTAQLRADPRLREFDFGAFEGGTFRENAERHGPLFLRWIEHPEGHPVPGGEGLVSFRDRVSDWFSEVEARTRSTGEASLTVVTHGGIIRMLAALLLNAAFSRVAPPVREPATALRLEGAPSRGWRIVPPGRSGCQGAGEATPLEELLVDTLARHGPHMNPKSERNP